MCLPHACQAGLCRAPVMWVWAPEMSKESRCQWIWQGEFRNLVQGCTVESQPLDCSCWRKGDLVGLVWVSDASFGGKNMPWHGVYGAYEASIISGMHVMYCNSCKMHVFACKACNSQHYMHYMYYMLLHDSQFYYMLMQFTWMNKFFLPTRFSFLPTKGAFYPDPLSFYPHSTFASRISHHLGWPIAPIGSQGGCN